MEWRGQHWAGKPLQHRGVGSSVRAVPGAQDRVVMVCEDIPEFPLSTGVRGTVYSIQHSLRLHEL